MILVRQSKSEDAGLVERFASLWRVVNDRLCVHFIDKEDIVPSMDVRSETLIVADKKMQGFFQLSSSRLLETNICSPYLQKHGYRIFPWKSWKKFLALILKKCDSVMLALFASRSVAAPRGGASNSPLRAALGGRRW